MTKTNWVEVLAAAVKTRGSKQVCKELGYSPATISTVLKGTYAANTQEVERRVVAIYGGQGIICPVLGTLEAARCAENFERAKKVGTRVSNPDTIRLHYNCLKCPVRG